MKADVSRTRWDLRLLRGITALFLFAMMAVTFADVVGRYLFSAPIYGAAEIIQVMLAITIFSAMGLVSHNDQHIAVDVFDAPLSRMFGRTRDILIGAVSTIGLLLVRVELARNGIDAIRTGRLTVVLEFSSAWMSLPGAVLCAVAAGLQITTSVRKR